MSCLLVSTSVGAGCTVDPSPRAHASRGCDSAMKVLAAVPFDDGTPAIQSARTATVHACRTEEEWLIAARRRATRSQNCVICARARLRNVLASICTTNPGEPACIDSASRDAQAQ